MRTKPKLRHAFTMLVRRALDAVRGAKDKCSGTAWSRLHRVESELVTAVGKKRPRIDYVVRRSRGKRQSRNKRDTTPE